MTPVPDIAGFADAQDRLRQELGQDIDFLIPNAATYDADVAIDPESGEPYDPTAVPESGGDFDTVTKTVNVIFRPLVPSRQDDGTVARQVGLMKTEGCALILAAADKSDVEDATAFNVNGIDYEISDFVPDGLGSLTRYIVFGEPK